MKKATAPQTFPPHQVRLAQIAKALGHPARIAILEVLLRRQSCVCGDIVAELPLAQPTVSQHLKVLKSVGLIQGTIDPRNSCYCIDRKAWDEAQTHIGTFFAQLGSELGCC